MACIKFDGGIMCLNDWARLRLGNRYVWVEYHNYCGPTFWWNSAMTKSYDPVDENDPIWQVFVVWFDKHMAATEKRRAKRVEELRLAKLKIDEQNAQYKLEQQNKQQNKQQKGD